MMFPEAYQRGRLEYLRNSLALSEDQMQSFPNPNLLGEEDSWWEGWDRERYNHAASGLSLGEYRKGAEIMSKCDSRIKEFEAAWTELESQKEKLLQDYHIVAETVITMQGTIDSLCDQLVYVRAKINSKPEKEKESP